MLTRLYYKSAISIMTDPNIRVNPPITKILDNLYLGDGKASRDKSILLEHEIKAVVSLSAGPWIHWHQPWYKEIIIEGNHFFLRCEDTMTQDLLPELANICDFIKKHLETGAVLIHCDRGVSRSVTALIAYLIRDCGYDLPSALALVKAKRKVKPNANFREQLEVWQEVTGEIWTAMGAPKATYAAFLVKRAQRLKDAGLTGNEPVGITSL